MKQEPSQASQMKRIKQNAKSFTVDFSRCFSLEDRVALCAHLSWSTHSQIGQTKRTPSMNSNNKSIIQIAIKKRHHHYKMQHHNRYTHTIHAYSQNKIIKAKCTPFCSPVNQHNCHK